MSPLRVLGTAVVVLVASVLVVGLAIAVLVGAVAAASGTGIGIGTGTGTGQVPGAMLVLYREAATSCPGLSYTVLAAIGTVESSNGTSDLPGVHGGTNFAGAQGPMQFEPATFAEYAEPVPPGGADPPSPYDPTDAVYAAARLLCANGAANGADVAGAVFSYNHSAAYVAQVMSIASSYEHDPPG
ncbi:MAG: lytic transglycosylase domain-containing protein [Acidimicrobiales bacterium]